MDAFIGTILPWPLDWAPAGWALCNGQTLAVNQYQALYALLGNRYGGDGRTTFALPNLQGRVPLGMGQADGQQYRVGMTGGQMANSVQLSVNNMPTHTHAMTGANANVPSQNVSFAMNVSTDNGERSVAQANDYLGAPTYTGRSANLYRGDANNKVAVSGVSGTVPAVQAPLTGEIGTAGLGQPVSVDNRQPYLVINYIIALEGIFPQRP